MMLRVLYCADIQGSGAIWPFTCSLPCESCKWVCVIVRRRYSMKGRQKGFSLIELLVVVAIILIIAAIAIPNFWRAKISANESSAVSSIHAIDTSEISYASMFETIG